VRLFQNVERDTIRLDGDLLKQNAPAFAELIDEAGLCKTFNYLMTPQNITIIGVQSSSSWR
jgi:hypothetical protein